VFDLGWSKTVQSCGPPGIEFEITALKGFGKKWGEISYLNAFV